MPKIYYMYVILTADNTFYCGFTNDVGKRFLAHETGRGAKYFRPKTRHPLTLLYAEAFDSKSAALKAEASFKKLTRLEKEKFLVAHHVSNLKNN